MKRILIQLTIILFLASILLSLASCSSAKTDIIGEWEDEEYKKGDIDKVLILGIFNQDRPLLRRNFEDGMSKAFNDGGVTASPSMDHMPYDEVIDSTTFEKYFENLEMDAVVVSRLVGLEQNRDYKAGYLYTIPYNNYYGFYGYYYAGIQYANASGYLSQNVVVVLETNIYETNDKKLIWSGISETVDPEKASDVIKSFGSELVSKLSRQGYFK
ncbi:MAG: hypothetical protein KJN64_07330 [Ignavibacteria bacterium]|nr:hypothetical protein [Ignavibacteria bacterium]MBT8382242.1 hypothetical protein [Ignavibacteria bacterium]MBT8390754.1 hypothetical protein [Ignavibacteria bacterium]NNJ53423.1 hypothetical protein [Ignavibacteriaceae bacterium]NNL22402.1 hypothetical protein [Ignavibacteriaceae bacterium]